MPKKVDPRIEVLCKGVNPTLKPQVETLAEAVIALQDKIESELPRYKEEPLSQEVLSQSGDLVIRQNPYVSEFRSMVKDYTNTLSQLQEIIGEAKEPATISALETMRGKIKAIN